MSVVVCKQCHKSLKRASKANIPPFPVCNGCEIRELLHDMKYATQPEIWLTSLKSFSPAVKIFNTGKHHTLTKPVTVWVVIHSK